MANIGFILHGKIRRRKKLLAELELFFADKHGIEIYETVRAMHATDLAVKAIEDGCDYIIAVGGDGTLSEVVNGFLSYGGKEKTGAALGVLPWGTGNDFVRSVDLGKSVKQLAMLIEGHSVKNLDAGLISILQADGNLHYRYFNNIADIGIGAEVVARVNGVHLRKKIMGGTLVFFLTALKTFMIYRHKKVRVSWPGFYWEGPLLSLVVANGRFFGSGLGIAPDALLDDGKFQVIIFGNLSVFDYLKKFGMLRRAERIDLPEVHYEESDEVNVFTALGDVSVEADGELSGKAPVSFKCLPAVLPFLIPLEH